MENTLMVTNRTLAVPGNDLDSYIQTIHNIPVLDAKQEKALAQRLRDDNDLEAARSLVMHNLRFVIKVARGYSGYGLPLNDLIQEGNVGLMKAVKRFDPSVNVRLISFAVHWIRAEIHEFILRNWKIVKVATTKAQRKLFFNLRSSKKRLGWLNHKEVTEVASDLGVSAKDVREMEKRMSGTDMSYDMPSANDDDDAAYSPSQYLVNHEASPEDTLAEADWDQHTRTLLAKAITELDDRSKDIITSRWLNEPKATLQDMAGKYNISAERIRQLENNAIKKIKLSVAA